VKNITYHIPSLGMGMMFFYLNFMEKSKKCKSLVIKTKKEKKERGKSSPKIPSLLWAFLL